MNFGLPRTVRKFFNVSETLGDRKSTRLNSSHSQISYAVFCLKKKKKKYNYDIHVDINNRTLDARYEILYSTVTDQYKFIQFIISINHDTMIHALIHDHVEFAQ